jgi:hypothetical protein
MAISRKAWLLKVVELSECYETPPIGCRSHSKSSRILVRADQKDDTHAWLVLEVVNRFWL